MANEAVTGMSLRDYFAGKALGAFLSEKQMFDVVVGVVGPGNSETTSRICYAYADAMIAEREKESDAS